MEFNRNNITEQYEDEAFVNYQPEPEKIYIMTLDDGTELQDLRLNGNNYVARYEIDESVFDHNLSNVWITDGETVEKYTNMALVQLTHESNGEYWFILRQITDEEMFQAKLRADIDYVAMMTDVLF